MTDREFDQLVDADARLINQYRQGMIDIIDYMKKRPDLFDSRNNEAAMSLNREQRLLVWHTWQAFLDHVLAMDAFGNIYSEYYKEFDDERKKTAFRSQGIAQD